MRMNDTVYRIVEIMFQDAEMNDEVRALHDEVMNNCQERFNDLVASGMTEDDAVAAVVESLRGLEDVISQYSRHTIHRSGACEMPKTAETAAEAETSGEQDRVFAASSVKKINLTLVHEDVTLEPSWDENYHVCWNEDADPAILVSMISDTIRIEHSNEQAESVRKRRQGTEASDKGHADVKIDTLEDLCDSIGKLMNRIFGKGGVLSRTINFGSNGITVYVPRGQRPDLHLYTTSGDMDITGITPEELSVSSVSGDVTVELTAEAHMPHVELHTTSGDVDATVFADHVKASSTSGDVEVEGRMATLNVSTISGDIDVRADVAELTFKAVSGDVDVILDRAEIRKLNGSTISGDVDVRLPDALGFMEIQTESRSGDVSVNCSTNGTGPVVKGKVSTMSGDIDIR